MKRVFLNGLLLIFILAGCSQKKYFFEKELVFPRIVNNEQKVKLAAYLVPTPQQYEWQQTELNAFIHFGINTFTGHERRGSEDAASFNPTDFDAEQWVRTLKSAGFNTIVLTVKNRDGFCLWPTETTSYSVASSPWRDGSGDVVKEVKDACDKYRMKFGISLSPWDRSVESVGDFSQYNNIFVRQLTELLSNYGEISEVRLGETSDEVRDEKIQKYDWEAFYKVIENLQPQAIKSGIMGDDVRWIGNDKGLARESEWSVTPLQPDINPTIMSENARLGLSPIVEDLGSRNLIVQAKKLYWYPGEANVSLRPRRFYHPEEDQQLKTLKQLVDIYFNSIGRNSALLLNVPLDTRGLLPETDARRLRQFSSYINRTFNDNKLIGGKLAWTVKADGFSEFNLTTGDTINVIMLQEDIQQGQRVEFFKVEGWIDNEWKKLTEGTTIGYKRLLKFDPVAPSKIRITVLETRDKANILNVGAFYALPAKENILNE